MKLIKRAAEEPGDSEFKCTNERAVLAMRERRCHDFQIALQTFYNELQAKLCIMKDGLEDAWKDCPSLSRLRPLEGDQHCCSSYH